MNLASEALMRSETLEYQSHLSHKMVIFIIMLMGLPIWNNHFLDIHCEVLGRGDVGGLEGEEENELTNTS